MILTILRLSYWRLLNNPLEIVLMFVVPIGFFTIFALILGKGIGGGKFPQTKTALLTPILTADQWETHHLNELRNKLKVHPTLKIEHEHELDLTDSQAVENKAKEIIASGVISAVIVLPDSQSDVTDTKSESPLPLIRIYVDQSDTIASPTIKAACQQILVEQMIKRQPTTPDAGVPSTEDKGLTQPSSPAFELNPPVTNFPPPLTEQMRVTPGSMPDQRASSFSMKLPEFEVVDALESHQTHRKYAMYAAGIAVMFLLFSASGAGGMLLEEKEAGTLERLLCTRLGITQLLVGKWCTITLNGLMQMIVMFAWAQFMFHVDFVGHLPEFMVMSTLTSGAAASLALMLASISRTRAQLNGIAVILILTMSALGGSMVPRYIMSEELKSYGKITFNAWALDGYDKIFWRNQPLESLKLECLVLLVSIILLGLLARIFAQNWVKQS